MYPTKHHLIHMSPEAILIPELKGKFDPWDLICNENEYDILDSFLESVLKCTSIPTHMPAMSLLNYPILQPTTDAWLMRRFSGNPLIEKSLLIHHLEICQAAIY